ncbi:mandelate racemase/muconate lactonizing enzyme family protein [Rhizobium leguminosarum bv. viciae]|nr:mandelate racemase/muconate lactonizing enzyme family protein [Rhizobium leguminosarum bv. viciae]
MKITGIEDLHVASALGHYSFLKITTDAGLAGWAEFNESGSTRPISALIKASGEQLIGKDPLPVQQIVTQLYQQSIQAPGGLAQRANAAIEMALWDIKGKSLGLPVHALFGGPVRDRIQVYWSHCGSYRIQAGEKLGVKPIRTPDDIAELGAEVKARGFKGLKTNCFNLMGGQLTRQMQGYGRQPTHAALNLERHTLDGIVATLRAFREGAGPEMNLHLDSNVHFRSEGYIRIARAIEQFDLTWLEMDMWDAQALADVRSKSPVPIASLEQIVGRRNFRPFFERGAVDFAIVDLLWNGWSEGLKVAAMAESFEINCAPHNYHGHLSSAISAHFCALIPNIKVMETDIDSSPWRDDLFLTEVQYEDGDMLVPTGSGWGMDVNESAARKYAADH